MKITDLVTPELIQLDVQGTTKAEVMQELVNLLDNAGALNDAAGYLQSLNDREAVGSTGIGFGVAIPHGKTDAVKTPRVAFGVQKSGVDWDSLDGLPANLIFMIAVPATGTGNEHLKIIQMLSRKIISEDFRSTLLQAATKDDVLNLLSTIE
ncbi:PTS sugar transporter subunit IIA [Tumebacillus sp. ITR2]|uniref:PTS sugar transporter subunit IIA n=1 Tax=Tumebacillus amylolyticus TaxID=2801339 RepID=A0ABS1J4R3_9BACL|nr:fructose PTS transporter subunit IIA [Tumebacillus amylolyticus]MBL0385175.1 PTS sugar transporter subunit IIA [Tumebacillus amylolyticus]